MKKSQLSLLPRLSGQRFRLTHSFNRGFKGSVGFDHFLNVLFLGSLYTESSPKRDGVNRQGILRVKWDTS
jgi:hypothetical protein